MLLTRHAGGPLGKLRDGDVISVSIDPRALTGSVDFVGTREAPLDPALAAQVLAARTPHPNLCRHPELPNDTRLWAALQRASGGTWAGCVYDVESIVRALEAGLEALRTMTSTVTGAVLSGKLVAP